MTDTKPTAIPREAFDRDLLIAEQQAYGDGECDAEAGKKSGAARYPQDLSAAYQAGYDDMCEAL